MDEASPALLDAVGTDIYTFTYTYRDACEGNPAFLLTADDAEKGKTLFLMVGTLNRFELLPLEEPVLEGEDSRNREDALCRVIEYAKV